uniref:Uncharacterized protein n=1 Tax=Anguilla anguilla TaxID=7936 RepID=A0A0E9PJC5_ANGAN
MMGRRVMLCCAGGVCWGVDILLHRLRAFYPAFDRGKEWSELTPVSPNGSMRHTQDQKA